MLNRHPRLWKYIVHCRRGGRSRGRKSHLTRSLVASEGWSSVRDRRPLYTTLHYTTLHYNTIQYNTMQCNAMQCSAVQCSAVQCSAVQCSAVHCNATQRNATQRNATQRNATQRNAIQYNTIQSTYKLERHFFDKAVGPRPNFARMCG